MLSIRPSMLSINLSMLNISQCMLNISQPTLSTNQCKSSTSQFIKLMNIAQHIIMEATILTRFPIMKRFTLL